MSLTELVRQSLEEIDDELRKEGVEIFQRPLHALLKLGSKFPQLNGMSLLPVENPQTELERVPGEIQAWYVDRYGDRLMIDLSAGSYPILIRDEPWRARLPLVYGRIRFFWDANTSTPQGKAELNIAAKIEELPPSLSHTLSNQEVVAICDEYLWAMNVLTSLSSDASNGMLEPAFTDYNAAIENLFSRNPHDGQCKWSALQFAEKALKQKLISLGEKPEKVHNLQKLANSLQPHGVNIDPNLITEVQCEASVRYGEIRVTRIEAVKAIQAALRIHAEAFPPDAFEFGGSP